MPDFLATASAWLNSVHREQVSQTVVIRVGAAESEEIPATIGATEFQEANDEGIVSNSQARDYLIAASDYCIEGVVMEPEAGHHIVEAGRTYEVMSPGDEPPARYSDAAQAVWRVHTKLISQ